MYLYVLVCALINHFYLEIKKKYKIREKQYQCDWNVSWFSTKGQIYYLPHLFIPFSPHPSHLSLRLLLFPLPSYLLISTVLPYTEKVEAGLSPSDGTSLFWMMNFSIGLFPSKVGVHATRTDFGLLGVRSALTPDGA